MKPSTSLPRLQPVEDPESYLQAVVQWHFSPVTGLRIGLRQVKALDVDPLTDVKTLRA